ncbi:MAG: porin family protein [Paludibacter sp.]|nr:porin family protein [Paludibacter sp.]MDD4198129.1 porin family protein [Paludibacter sp.]MDD4427375.1 porin family protein [Paludibacter sp.]
MKAIIAFKCRFIGYLHEYMVKKFFFLFFFLLALNNLSAQGNLTDLDYKTFRLGFCLGTNFMDLKVEHTELIQDGKIYYADVPDIIPGFTVGLITDLRLQRYFNLRFTPSLLLGERNLRFKAYDVNTGVLEDDKIVNLFSLPVDIPVYLRYSAERYGNFKPYVQVGIGTSFDLGRDEQTDVTLSLSDYYFSAGVGCDLYFRFFKLSPELKFNFGRMNVLTPKEITEDTSANLKYTNAISRLLSRVLVFSLNIE